ncbi:hypothetical protein NDU88_004390 [Pleurodeles waltl]|uniref:Uncharacterized protein n=1 Tax=Pleurodeles waltl TaxID=8319 RepID=A0AAV7V136_PLEWA|nr:hypothetical protein NDU88_004390 [Pleurodeles waltl]
MRSRSPIPPNVPVLASVSAGGLYALPGLATTGGLTRRSCLSLTRRSWGSAPHTLLFTPPKSPDVPLRIFALAVGGKGVCTPCASQWMVWGSSPPRVRLSLPAESRSRNGFTAPLRPPFCIVAAAKLSGVFWANYTPKVAADLKNVSAGDATVAGDSTGLLPISRMSLQVMDSRLVLRRQHLGRRQLPVGAKEGNLWMTMTEELPTWVAADLKNVSAGDATVAGDPTGSRKWGALQNPTSLCPPHVCSMFINERAVMDSRLVLRRQHLGRRQLPVGAKEGNLWMTMTEELPTWVAADLKNVSAGDATVAGDPTVPCQLCVLHHPRKDTFLLSCGSSGILGRKDTGQSLDFLLFHMVADDLKNVSAGDATVAGDPTAVCPPSPSERHISSELWVNRYLWKEGHRLVLRRQHLSRRQIPVGAKEKNLRMTMTEELPTWIVPKWMAASSLVDTSLYQPSNEQSPYEDQVMDSRLVLRRLHLGSRQVPVGAKEGNLWMTMTEELPTWVAADLKNVSAGDATVAGDPTDVSKMFSVFQVMDSRLVLRRLHLGRRQVPVGAKERNLWMIMTESFQPGRVAADLKNVSAGDATVAGDPTVPCQLCVLHHPRKDTFLLSCGSSGILGRKDTGQSLDFLLFHM